MLDPKFTHRIAHVAVDIAGGGIEARVHLARAVGRAVGVEEGQPGGWRAFDSQRTRVSRSVVPRAQERG